jgi:hypothetical protein
MSSVGHHNPGQHSSARLREVMSLWSKSQRRVCLTNLFAFDILLLWTDRHGSGHCARQAREQHQEVQLPDIAAICSTCVLGDSYDWMPERKNKREASTVYEKMERKWHLVPISWTVHCDTFDQIAQCIFILQTMPRGMKLHSYLQWCSINKPKARVSDFSQTVARPLELGCVARQGQTKQGASWSGFM